MTNYIQLLTDTLGQALCQIDYYLSPITGKKYCTIKEVIHRFEIDRNNTSPDTIKSLITRERMEKYSSAKPVNKKNNS